MENKESDKVLLKDLATRSKNEDINNFVQVYATCRSMGGDLGEDHWSYVGDPVG